MIIYLAEGYEVDYFYVDKNNTLICFDNTNLLNHENCSVQSCGEQSCGVVACTIKNT